MRRQIITIFQTMGLFLIIFTGTLTMAQAQCVPDYLLSYNGISPRQLPSARENVPYLQKIHFKWPKDTALGQATLTFDSLVLLSMEKLPTSISWVSDTITNSWAGGDAGCVLFQGTPPTGSAFSDSIKVNVRAFFKLFGNTTYRDFSEKIAFTILKDSTQNSVAEVIQRTGISVLNTYWGEDQKTLFLDLESKKATRLQLRCIDLNGKMINHESVQLQAGSQIISFNSGVQSAGIYLINMQTDKGSWVKRVVRP